MSRWLRLGVYHTVTGQPVLHRQPSLTAVRETARKV